VLKFVEEMTDKSKEMASNPIEAFANTQGPQQTLMVQHTVDISALVRENHLLILEKGSIQTQLEQLRAKYQSVLETEVREKELLKQDVLLNRTALEDLRKENQSLRDENTSLRVELAKLKSEFEINAKETKILVRNAAIARNKLLLGSVAYNYIDCAVFFIFKTDPKKKRKTLRTIEDIEDAQKNPQEQARWDEFKSKFWKDGYDDVLESFTGGRLELAHPTTMTDEEEECPTPKDLQQIVMQLYNNKKSKKVCGNGQMLIDDLDLLARALGRDILV